MLPPFKVDADEVRARAQVFTGRERADDDATRDDPDRRLIEHWQRLFAKNRARKTGSA